MIDFLIFKSFMSPWALIVIYYMGAVVLPVAGWVWIFGHYGSSDSVGGVFQAGGHALWHKLDKKRQLRWVGVFIVLFLLMELFWRILFEFLIGYMQMRDALVSALCFA